MRKSLVNIIDNCFINNKSIKYQISNGIYLDIMFNSKRKTINIDLICFGTKHRIEINKTLELYSIDIDKIVDNIILNINRNVIKLKNNIISYEEKL